MQRTKAAGRSTTLPAKTNAETAGYFKNRDTLLGDAGTTVTADDLNTIQEELVAIATMGGATLDTADNGQCADVLRPVLALDSDTGATGLPDSTTYHKVAAIASAGVEVGGTGVLCAAAIASSGSKALGAASTALACLGEGEASGDASLIAASSLSAGHGALGDRSAVVACLDSDASGLSSFAAGGDALQATGPHSVALGGDTNVASGDASAVLGGDNNTVSGTDSVALGTIGASVGGISAVVLGGTSCIADTEGAVVVGSQQGKIPSTSNSFITMLAARACDADLGNSGNGAPAYSVCGGFSASTDVAPSWRIDSNGGYMRSTNAHTTSGLDYAEMFPNGDGVAHAPARLLALFGDQARLAERGHPILGTVSVAPTVVGGSDALGWQGQHVRDELGALVWADVDVVEMVPDRAALAAHRTKTEELLKAANRAQRDLLVARVEHRARARALEIAHRDAASAADRAPFKKKADAISARDAAEAALIAHAAAPVSTMAHAAAIEALAQHRATVPDQIERFTTTRALARNPAYDPARGHVPRSQRPSEWSQVALLGQVPVLVDAKVKAGDMVMPEAGGRGTTADREYLLEAVIAGGARCSVMKITTPFDEAKGYAVALCLLR